MVALAAGGVCVSCLPPLEEEAGADVVQEDGLAADQVRAFGAVAVATLGASTIRNFPLGKNGTFIRDTATLFIFQRLSVIFLPRHLIFVADKIWV